MISFTCNIYSHIYITTYKTQNYSTFKVVDFAEDNLKEDTKIRVAR